MTASGMGFTLTDLDNPHFDFSKHAQPILEERYLAAYPEMIGKKVEKDPKEFTILHEKIKRVVHGALHAARVAAYVKVLHAFRLSHLDQEALDMTLLAKDLDLTVTQISFLTQFAGLFHDSAREGEGNDHWDQESSEKFLNDISTLLPKKTALLFSGAIAFKDQKDKYAAHLKNLEFDDQLVKKADYIRQLIADADCLDIIRIRKNFRMQYLNLCQSEMMKNDKFGSDVLRLAIHVRELISHQKDMYFPCNIIPLIVSTEGKIDLELSHNSFDFITKCEYEFSSNVYQKVTDDMQSYSLLAIGTTKK